MNHVSRRKRVPEVPTLVYLEGPLAQARAEAESFVQEAFRVAYGAKVAHFMTALMTLRNDSGDLLAVLGLRDAAGQGLFLEQYLEQPIEQALGAVVAAEVDRRSLVEVGNFAVGAAGGGRWLITALTAYLHSAGRSWAVFTCGPELQNAFRRLGIHLVELAPADPARLPAEERPRWGSYYAQMPKVMAASVAHSHEVLSALFERECRPRGLWSAALQAGRLAA